MLLRMCIAQKSRQSQMEFDGYVDCDGLLIVISYTISTQRFFVMKFYVSFLLPVRIRAINLSSVCTSVTSQAQNYWKCFNANQVFYECEISTW